MGGAGRGDQGKREMGPCLSPGYWGHSQPGEADQNRLWGGKQRDWKEGLSGEGPGQPMEGTWGTQCGKERGVCDDGRVVGMGGKVRRLSLTCEVILHC